MEKETQHSENFIKQKVGKTSGFTTPKKYFDDVEYAVFSKLKEEKLSKQTGFTVPKNYFETVEFAVLDQLSSNKKEVKVISLKDRFLKVIPYVAAASIVLFLGINAYFLNTNSTISFDSLNANDMEFWLEHSDLQTTDVAVVLESDLQKDTHFSLTDIEDEHIEDYINNIDND